MDFVLKISERCNLACPYCYYYFQSFDNSSLARQIRPEVAHKLGPFIVQGAEELGIDRVTLAFHGGEPLLIRKRYFDQMCTMLGDCLRGHVTYSFSLQTNGTLIDAEWIDLFVKHGVKVGVSLDGPRHHHDASRPDKRGRGSYDGAVRGLNLLKQACRDGKLPFVGALCVANPTISATEIFRHFSETLGVPGFSLLLPRAGWGSDIEKQQKDWIAYFSQALDYWLSAVCHGNAPYNRILSDAMLPMLSDSLATTCDWKLSSRHHVITISSEGDLFADDNLFSVDSSFSQSGMTVFNTSLREFMQSPMWRSLIAAIDSVPPACSDCEWYRICRSGELFNRFRPEAGPTDRSVFCETLDYIYSRIADFLVQHGYPLTTLAERLTTPPAFSAAAFSTEALIARKNQRSRSSRDYT